MELINGCKESHKPLLHREVFEKKYKEPEKKRGTILHRRGAIKE